MVVNGEGWQIWGLVYTTITFNVFLLLQKERLVYPVSQLIHQGLRYISDLYNDDDSLLHIFTLKMNYNMFTLAIRKNIKIFTF